MIGDRVLARCPRCDGPLFQTDDRDYAFCLTHGEQFIGVLPAAELDPPGSGPRRMGTGTYKRKRRAAG
jgi:hypothetical protein